MVPARIVGIISVYRNHYFLYILAYHHYIATGDTWRQFRLSCHRIITTEDRSVPLKHGIRCSEHASTTDNQLGLTSFTFDFSNSHATTTGWNAAELLRLQSTAT